MVHEVAGDDGGEGREGGPVERRNARVFVWNTKPKNQEYYTDKWNEFLASCNTEGTK
jgi:putative spermidine/putrescine transport system substrate-binding protein